MYNRYIPQSDGSYSRKSVQNPKPQPQKQNPKPPQPPPPPEPMPNPGNTDPMGISGFLRRILPREFDTGDLLIVLLLLLMAGDCEEEKHNALLTLALYFFL